MASRASEIYSSPSVPAARTWTATRRRPASSASSWLSVPGPPLVGSGPVPSKFILGNCKDVRRGPCRLRPLSLQFRLPLLHSLLVGVHLQSVGSVAKSEESHIVSSSLYCSLLKTTSTSSNTKFYHHILSLRHDGRDMAMSFRKIVCHTLGTNFRQVRVQMHLSDVWHSQETRPAQRVRSKSAFARAFEHSF